MPSKKELRNEQIKEELWTKIFSKIDEACDDEGWHKDGIRKLFLKIKKLCQKDH